MLKKIIRAKLKFFAKAILQKYQPQIIGITGSVGKSSAKEAIYAVLKDHFRTRRNLGNYNNEIGLPLAIIGKESGNKSIFKWLSIFAYATKIILFKDKNYPEILILEMGADHPGDIKYLTGIIHPEISVVTAVAPVHIEFFGSFDKVIKEKSIIVRSLPEDGFAVLNYDDVNVHRMSKTTKARLFTFGFKDGAMVEARELQVSFKKENLGEELGRIEVPIGINFKLTYEGNTLPVHLRGMLGSSSVYAALAAAAVGLAHNLNLVEISRGLEQYKAPKGRMNIIAGIKHTTLIDDSYNSSPIAAEAALQVLGGLPPVEGSKKIAVLGDMLELGNYTEEGHRRVGESVAQNKIDILITAGERARFIAEEAKAKGMPEENIFSFDSAEEAGPFLQDKLEKGDIVLIKGSQGTRMEKVAKEVMAEPLKACDLLVRQDKSWECR